ncbi:acyltransferase [Kaistella pullorum]|uniref:Acyltransferase n=1 Tax=Kaistella pullorum TaxID=2763074 RepID=A0ABR8WJ81_9FLAO|nr:acyltransferase [Kaistella pullorum]MBD8017028.1 acyltransferase [Kaistella pullorum]
MDKIWYIVFKGFFFLKAKIRKKQAIYYKKQVENNCRKFTAPLRVNGPTYVSKYTELGKNVSFNGMTIGGKGEVIIGDNFHSGVGCKILTQIHNYEGDALPYDDKIIPKNTVIGDNVWFGDDVTIIGGVSIGNGVIIQAGSVVVSNIPDYAIAGGHPAKIFKERNVEHYNKLLKEKKFH